jgi:hypothetical protein
VDSPAIVGCAAARVANRRNKPTVLLILIMAIGLLRLLTLFGFEVCRKFSVTYGPGVYTPPVVVRKKPVQSWPPHTIICDPVQTAENMSRAAGAETMLVEVHESVAKL